MNAKSSQATVRAVALTAAFVTTVSLFQFVVSLAAPAAGTEAPVLAQAQILAPAAR